MPGLLVADCVHTRLPHSVQRNARQKGGTRSRSGGPFLPDHRQNKYLAIFAMHLSISVSLSLPHALYISVFLLLLSPAATFFRSCVCAVVCTLPPLAGHVTVLPRNTFPRIFPPVSRVSEYTLLYYRSGSGGTPSLLSSKDTFDIENRALRTRFSENLIGLTLPPRLFFYFLTRKYPRR